MEKNKKTLKEEWFDAHSEWIASTDDTELVDYTYDFWLSKLQGVLNEVKQEVMQAGAKRPVFVQDQGQYVNLEDILEALSHKLKELE